MLPLPHLEDVTSPCTPQLNAHKLGKIAATSDTNNSTTMDPIAMAIIWLDSQSEPNYTEAAKKFGVNRTTVSRRHRGITTSRKQFISTFKKNLTDAQEEQLLEYLNALTQQGLPPTHQMLENLVVEILKEPIGENWTRNFVGRHNDRITSKFLRTIDMKRIKADREELFNDFYQLASI
jgi:transposase